MARLLPPESAAVDVVAREIGVGAATLERWRADALSMPARERAWTAAARFDAVLITAAMDEAAKSAWCREHGVYPQELDAWRQSAKEALAEPEEVRASPQQTARERRRIKELERKRTANSCDRVWRSWPALRSGMAREGASDAAATPQSDWHAAWAVA